MCEACGPLDGQPERIRPELMVKLQERNATEAKRRGLTMEQFEDADYLVSRKNRFLSWLESAWLNLQLFRPSL